MSTGTATYSLEMAVPARRAELVISPDEATGRSVIKNRITGNYFMLGGFESFLLEQLDGRQTVAEVCAAFERRFNEPLSDEEFSAFVEIARRHDLLARERPASDQPVKPRPQQSEAPSKAAEDSVSSRSPRSHAAKRARQSLLFFRVKLIDPDRLLAWLERPLRFVWTRAFVIGSASMILAAMLIVILNSHQLLARLAATPAWQSLVILWAVILVSTMVHEFAHGLTCKHYGGDVHEIGALFMFFTPYFYCNVSDAWLLPEKRKRLWITAAGTYCDLCVWAMAVFTWRLTIQDALVNYLAWGMVVVCGTRVLLNCNPLMKLDGYYFLSDLLDIPNLRRRSQAAWMSLVRWLLWGGTKPPGGRVERRLLIYGLCGWAFSLFFLHLVFVGLFRFFGQWLGWAGSLAGGYLAFVVVRRLFRGFTAGEVKAMLLTRHLRTAIWLVGLGGLVTAACLVEVDHRAGGTFQIRPASRVEVRAPVAGFLQQVVYDEGDRVSASAVVARLNVPDLDSQISRKRAEIDESTANLKKLEAGPRPEEIAEQRQRVVRLEHWRDLAQQDLTRAKQSLTLDLERYAQQAEQARAELDFASQSLAQAEQLFAKGAVAGQQLASERKKRLVLQALWRQAQANSEARRTEGTLEFEAEAARRDKELGDARSILALLEAGGRPEDIEAEHARRARMQEELKFLEAERVRLTVASPIGGLVITPRIKEKIGQYLEKGDLICVVEDKSAMQAELLLSEQDVAGVVPGQAVEFKARALPFEIFHGRVERLAPAAILEKDDVQSKLVAYCVVDDASGELRSGMTGFARIHRPPRRLGIIVLNDVLRYVRTEFWW